MSLRFYLAARYSRLEEMRGYATDLAQLGLGTAELAWLSGTHEWDGSQQPGEELARAQRFALDDLADLAKAQVVVVFTEEPGAGGRNRGGRHVEYGLALANALARPKRQHVVIVGPAENVFHTLPMIPRFATWQDAVAHLIEVQAAASSAAIRARLIQ